MKKDFYVYEWFNVDTNEVFYVGKGIGNRFKNKQCRNKYFQHYITKYNCDVRKVATDLNEDEAFKLEIDLIKRYREINQCKCNLTNGGEGSTFPVGSWDYYYRKLFMYHLHGLTDIMYNACDYEPENLKNKSLKEIEFLHNQLIDEKENCLWISSLDIYDEDGDLNIGWECFEN